MHDEYYTHLLNDADDRLARASGAHHKAESCSERFEQLASVIGPHKAAAIEAYMDGRVAHHELHEHKAHA